jgi:F-type H+-transporting ATPase subunit b
MAERVTAHTEQPSGAHKEPFPPFQTETFAEQLFWLALTFIILYLIMSRVALPRIGGILEARRRRIAEDLALAQRLKAESETTLASYEQALAEARGRAQAIAAEMHKRMTAESEARRHALETELKVQLADAEAGIAATKATAMANVRAIAVEATAAIIERLTGTAAVASSVDAAVNAALEQGEEHV